MERPLASVPFAAAALFLGCSFQGPTHAADEQLPFGEAWDVQIPGVLQPTGLSSADFDRDGRPDLVVLSGSNARIKILLNTPAGFREGGELDAGTSAGGLEVGDFDEDGEADLAVCHHDTDEVWIFLGKGAGSFQTPRTIPIPVKKPHAHRLQAVDVDADSHIDLLLAQADDNHLWILLGDGKGGFQPSPTSPLGTGNHPYGCASSDFNGDGRLDFVTPNWYGKSISVFLGGEQGAIKEASSSPLTGFTAPTAVEVGDLTGDGKVDLAVGNDDSSKVQVLGGDGNGGFTAAAILEAKEDCFAPILADLEGNGRLDVIATAVNSARTFSYWINLGDGRFGPAHSLPCPSLASTICVSDFNADGAVDLVVGTREEPKLLIWHGRKSKH